MINVGDLKKALKDIPDNVPIAVVLVSPAKVEMNPTETEPDIALSADFIGPHEGVPCIFVSDPSKSH
jgi:hypothetical protein